MGRNISSAAITNIFQKSTEITTNKLKVRMLGN